MTAIIVIIILVMIIMIITIIFIGITIVKPLTELMMTHFTDIYTSLGHDKVSS